MNVLYVYVSIMYVLDGLTDEFIVPHNAGLVPANHVHDPFPDDIMAMNEWLHWYDTNIYIHMYTHTFIYMNISISTCIYTYTG